TACVAFTGAFRSEIPATTLAAILLAGSLPAASLKPRGARDLIYERVTPYQTLQVFEVDGVRTLKGDRVPQAAVSLATREPALPYQRAAPAVLLISPHPRRALLIGLGGGTIGRYLQSRDRQIDVQYVDIAPAVSEIARRFFFFQPGPRMRIAIEDGRQYLHASNEKWDLIYADAYIGQSVPFHLTTVQFLDEVKRHLNPGGAFALNLAGGLGDPFSQSMYLTVRERFDSAYFFRVPRAFNALVVASESADTLSRDDLLQRGRDLDRTLRFDPTLATLATWRTEVALDTAKVQVLSDEFAPVDRLIRLGQKAREAAGER
ncbi:MAG TPA: fused MFS/spermidine synthase, partial [Thermoanaerobaculia bacterium]